MELEQAPTTTMEPTTRDGDSGVLDDAFDRMGGTDFELPNGFVNHGPMACEALAALGCQEKVPEWARWFVQMVGEGPRPVEPARASDFEGLDALGDYRRLPEWLGFFDRSVADDGWEAVVALWVPRLIPGLSTALFHGVIRTAHAVRAVRTVGTAPRQAELSRALGYWAARFGPGHAVPAPGPGVEANGIEESGRAVMASAADGARHYVEQPSIFNLHGVTGAMAVALLLDHVGVEAAPVAVAQVRAEHAWLYGGPGPTGPVTATAEWDPTLAPRAADSRDAHEVKLVEACRRGWEATGDVAFLAAAERVSQ
jgi:hypothetical protein